MSLQELIQSDDWQDIRLLTFAGALNTFLDPDNIQPNELTEAQNVRIEGDRIIDMVGYNIFRNHEASPRVAGDPMDVISFTLQSGVVANLMVSTEALYVDNGTQWRMVPISGVSTTVNANQGDSQTTITVASSASFSVNDPISIQLDNGNYHSSVITAIPGGTSITIRDQTPDSITIGNTVEGSFPFTGDTDDLFTMVAVPWSDQVVITNNKDQIQVYSDSTGQIAALTNPSGVTTLLCKYLAVFDSSLFLFNTTEDGTRFPQRERHSDKADITNWDTGNAGSQDLFESTEPINTAAKLGPYLIIYRQKGIHRLSVSSNPDRRFDIDPMIPDQGVESIGGVTNISENKHLVWGLDNFYEYTGGFDITPIGDNIKSLVFGREPIADPAEKHQQRLLYIQDFNETMAVFQATGDTGPKNALLYKMTEQRWTTRVFTDPVRGGVKIPAAISIIWSGAVGTWAEQNYSWNSSFLNTGSPALIFASDFDTYEIVVSAGLDDGTVAPDRIVATKDFSEYPIEARLDWIELKLAGSGAITVEFSTDEGETWTTYDTVTPTLTPTLYRLYKQVIYESIRFRLTTTQPGFALYSGSMRVSPETER